MTTNGVAAVKPACQATTTPSVDEEPEDPAGHDPHATGVVADVPGLAIR